MNYNVLVTGVGAIIGYGIVRAIKKSNKSHRVIGVDIYDDAIGQEWCDDFITGKMASDDEYVEFMLDLCLKERVSIIIPGIEQDMFSLMRHVEKFDKINTKIAINDINLIDLCKDKWLFYRYFLGTKFERLLIPTSISGSYEENKDQLGDTFLLKPRRSYASKGILKIECENDFSYWKNKLGDNFMVQKVIGNVNDEYTASVFGYGNGETSESIIFKRKLSGEGATAKAEVVLNKQIDTAIGELSSHLKPLGATNFQFRFDDEQLKILEINPRISSATSLRELCGYNEAIMSIDFFLNGKKQIAQYKKSGTIGRKFLRYIEDHSI
ncbi:ATP-grasp domain-containing protein [Shewanella litoralis]|uniref:ATP-grasp domain-containing protein n=1 Tax=Shewanella litoralis TaxID=2282700 RepID=A0ABQ2RJ95_9GAMM|nr:ATP-grasp domain-containing protein [Shewanella litoralis]GGQ33885.1 hypothetical protein GCM10009411_36570 [Shewanella litoralis]